MSGFSTLRDRAEALREGIEELLLEERSKTATEHLKEAEAAVSRFCDLGASDAGIAALDGLRERLDRAKASVGSTPDTALFDEALVWASELRALALDELAQTAPADLAKHDVLPFGFRASKGSPSVYEARDVPPLQVFAKIRAWDDLEEDDEEDEAAEEKRIVSPLHVGLARLGRDTMEDVAILGGLRRLEDEERWSDADGFEQRLLANLDLLWALDAPIHDDVPKLGVPRSLFAYATEWALPDWGRAFALSFGLGCSSSEAALRWVMLAMRRSATSVLGAYVHGLSLASGPYVNRTISAELRTDAPPELLAALLEIAERRQTFEASAVVPLLAHPTSIVKVAALGAMRTAPKEIAITSALSMLGASDESVGVQAADELARRNNADGLAHLRGVLLTSRSSADKGVALRALSLAGNPNDEGLLAEHALPREDGVMWLSFFGRVGVVPLILQDLQKRREAGPLEAVRMARAERAFNRVTGLDPSADPPALQTKFEQSGMAKKGTRLRGGEPHSARAIVAELLSPISRQGERRVLARELPLVVPNAPLFDVDGFTAAQVAALSSVEMG